MINPFNGEGIEYAMETGKLAAGMVVSALAHGASSEIPEYRIALHDIYAGYFRLGRTFLRGISKPELFRVMCQFGMSSRTVMAFALQVLANLAEERGGRIADRSFRGMVRLATKELEELEDPQIPTPSGSKEPVGAASPP
jgi:flavin-dependent dehydrogenase